jgi:RNA binding exosome subunit
MIHSIEDNSKIIQELQVQIVPKLKSVDAISLSSGDTLVALVDHNIWDISEAEQFYKILEQTFPKNNILILFDGIELKVIKNEN